MADPLQQGVSLTQEQKQVLSAAQIHSLELLTLNFQELDAFLEKQLLENPLLESGAEEEAEDKDASGRVEEGRRKWEEEYAEDYYGHTGGSFDRDIAASERTGSLAHYDNDLPHHLLLQISLDAYPPQLRRAVQTVIYALDEDGYLRVSLSELAAGVPLEEGLLEQALQQVQRLDPPGVGARSLVECLCLQVPERHPERELITGVIAQHLPDLAAGRFRSVSRELGVSETKLRHILDYVRTLEPRPASSPLAQERPDYIVPDIIVRWSEGTWRVLLIGSRRHHLRVNAYYQELLSERSADEAAQAYLKQKLTDATQLIRSMDRRRETLIKVAGIFIRHQEGFLSRGLEELRPLTLRQVAQEAGLHESTVCRAISGKYVDTPRGVYPVRFFFSRSYAGEAGQTYAGAYVRSLIASMIAAEDKASPLSDRQIEEALALRGVKVARRTIAKYRDDMGIPKKSFRRR